MVEVNTDSFIGIVTIISGIIAYGGIIPAMIGVTIGTFITGSTFANAARKGLFWGFIFWLASWGWLIHLADQAAKLR